MFQVVFSAEYFFDKKISVEWPVWFTATSDRDAIRMVREAFSRYSTYNRAELFKNGFLVKEWYR